MRGLLQHVPGSRICRVRSPGLLLSVRNIARRHEAGNRKWARAMITGGYTFLLTLTIVAAAARPAQSDSWASQRLDMVEAIEEMAATTPLDTDDKPLSSSVMAVMGRVARQEFVPARVRELAYLNRPLPIGHGQTISQPYIVALMTDLLNVGPEDVVLEVGTGSGYQAAVLGELVRQVYTLEIIRPLGEQAAERLKRLGYDNIETRVADGYYGWEEHAPYDGIIVTAAASHVPPPLVQQLKPGGRMIIPVGGRFLTQYLMLVEKDAQGKVTTRQVLPVRFVPLTGDH